MGKSILQYILAYLARRTVKKYRPRIIGITGSVGKTSTRRAVFSVLKRKYRVRTAEKNYNTEIGLPLAVLGIPHCGKNAFRWAYWFLHAVLPEKNYPEVLVLEYGIDHPGDMDYLLSIARPDIAVVTAIGDVPVHVEFFSSPEELIREKAKLAASLEPKGIAILNHDDEAVREMKEKTPVRAVTFGQEEHADFQIVNYELRIIKDENFADIPGGVSFKIQHGGHIVPFRMPHVFGMPYAYAAAAAAAAGVSVGMNLVEISEALQNYAPPPGRLQLLRGNKRFFILDDTYNAAPGSMRAALDTLKTLPGKRKIAVLGDMRELGRFSEQAHRAIGDQTAKFVDILFAVGPHAKFIAEEFEALAPGRTAYRFDDSHDAGRALDPLTQEGDLVLIKGSQAMRMERTVEEIMAEPSRAPERLVRQEEYWKNLP